MQHIDFERLLAPPISPFHLFTDMSETVNPTHTHQTIGSKDDLLLQTGQNA
jgi:hypothetical protein